MDYKNVVAFTGHRPSKLPWRHNEMDAGCVALKEVLTEQIAAQAEAGVTQFLSGMAEGCDLWCSQIVLHFRKENPAIKLHCILPCKEQAEKWSAPSRELYRSILEQTDSIIYVSRDYHKIVCWTATAFWWTMLQLYWLSTMERGEAGPEQL